MTEQHVDNVPIEMGDVENNNNHQQVSNDKVYLRFNIGQQIVYDRTIIILKQFKRCFACSL